MTSIKPEQQQEGMNISGSCSFFLQPDNQSFQYILQIATAKNMVRATQDIKGAYLNAPLPDDDDDVILTKLDDNIADIFCGLTYGKVCTTAYHNHVVYGTTSTILAIRLHIFQVRSLLIYLLE